MVETDDRLLKKLAILKNKGHLFIISGPSGVGKGTLLSLLLKKFPEILLSVSVTTRTPRIGETDGVNYHFTTRENFEEMIKQDKLIEWAEFAGNYYGTYTQSLLNAFEQSKDIALEIDVQGALQIKSKIKEAIMIFILPPSIDELEQRLLKRNTETKESIQNRLAIVREEVTKLKEFDYEIINENLDEALMYLESIVLAERSRIKRS